MKRLAPLSVLILIIIIILITPVYYLRPVKTAVKEKDLADRSGYILVEVEKVTDYRWKLVGDESGLFNEKLNKRGIWILGKEPLEGYNYDVEVGDNILVCYGKYIGEVDFHGTKYEQYEAYDWDILYPVKRNSPLDFILPDGYLCYFDTIQ